MKIQSVLIQGAGSALTARVGSLSSASPPLDALVLMSLGVDGPVLLDAVHQNKDKIKCPVYLTDTYGILGFDEDLKQNVELLEKGRGSEYGFCGGSGGQGCLAIGYYEGAIAGHTADFPQDVSSLMVIADQSKSWAKDKSKAPLHFGGITKKCWKVNVDAQTLQEVPYFWVAETSGEPTGVATFKGNADEATKTLLHDLPNGWQVTGDVGLFPCFTRGINQYGEENVETQAIGTVMASPSPRIYGMFAHGELGPSTFNSFTNEANNHIECDQHGMSSILSIHTTKAQGNEEL